MLNPARLIPVAARSRHHPSKSYICLLLTFYYFFSLYSSLCLHISVMAHAWRSEVNTQPHLSVLTFHIVWDTVSCSVYTRSAFRVSLLCFPSRSRNTGVGDAVVSFQMLGIQLKSFRLLSHCFIHSTIFPDPQRPFLWPGQKHIFIYHGDKLIMTFARSH